MSEKRCACCGQREYAEEMVARLREALATRYYVDWEYRSFFDPDDPTAPHEEGYRLYHVYEDKPMRMGAPVAHYRDEAEANADAARRNAALAAPPPGDGAGGGEAP